LAQAFSQAWLALKLPRFLAPLATMKACGLIVLCQLWTAAAMSAQSAAEAWLRNHQSPSDGQLGELATANPQAFAIVSALLNKRHKNSLPEAERGPDVFLKMMGPRHLSAAAEKTEVAIPYNIPEGEGSSTMAMDDAKTYNPNSAEDKDATMVDGLLGAVANIAGKRGGKIALLRNRYHRNEEQQQQQQVADAVFSNPFGNIAQKKALPTRPPMSEEEKEQRAAAGLPLTDIPGRSQALLVEHAKPNLYNVAAVTVAPDMERVETPKPKNALAAWLR